MISTMKRQVRSYRTLRRRVKPTIYCTMTSRWLCTRRRTYRGQLHSWRRRWRRGRRYWGSSRRRGDRTSWRWRRWESSYRYSSRNTYSTRATPKGWSSNNKRRWRVWPCRSESCSKGRRIWRPRLMTKRGRTQICPYRIDNLWRTCKDCKET